MGKTAEKDQKLTLQEALDAGLKICQYCDDLANDGGFICDKCERKILGKKRAIDPRAPGTTPQGVETPKCLLDPVRRVYGKLGMDLAASRDNVCDVWFGEDVDSLSLDWHQFELEEKENFWLNPPFSNSSTFLAKCSEESSKGCAPILSLVQSAPGCDYWGKTVWRNPLCQVIWLLGRVPYVGYGNGANIDCVIIRWHQSLENLHPALRILTWDWRDPSSVPKNAWPVTLETLKGGDGRQVEERIAELNAEIDRLSIENYEISKMLGRER